MAEKQDGQDFPMNKFNKFISEIPTDKKWHYGVGFAITIIMSIFFSFGAAFMSAVVIAACKELFDKITGKGIPDIHDFIYMSAGAFTAYIAEVIIKFILYWLS